MKKIYLLFSFCLMAAFGVAQDWHVLPTMSPAGGSFDDYVVIRCTWPEGCAGGVYYTQGGEITAQPYCDSIVLRRSVQLSVAGVNSEGRIITDPVSCDFTIRQTIAPSIISTPEEGIRETSFYVTAISWQNVLQSVINASDFKEGGSRAGQPAVWLCDSEGQVLSTGTYNNIWQAGLNNYKIYFYKSYKQPAGHYTLHIAGGLFILDGQPYEEELVLHYEVIEPTPHPVITPASGDYTSPLTVQITYPTDGSAFYPFYQINDGDPQIYDGSFTLTESATVTAYGYDELMEHTTQKVSASYTLHAPQPKPDPLPDPVFSRSGDMLTISTSVSGAVIKYWPNDRMQQAERYSAPIHIAENVKLSCLVYTADNQSRVVDYRITDVPTEPTETGTALLMTPEETTGIHVMGMSENGRYAVGFIGENLTMRGFIWDLSSGHITYPTRAYIGQLLSVSNNGIAYGWRTPTITPDEQTGDDDMFWGVVSDGVWTEKPADLEVFTITGEGLLRGWHRGEAVFYDPYTGTYTPDELIARIGRVSALSPNEEWAVIDQSKRLHIPSGQVEEIITTHYLYPNEPRPEQLVAIANDGNIFGTYRAGYAASQMDEAIIYTTDGTWRWLRDWLRIEYGDIPELYSYRLTGLFGCTGDHLQFLLQAFPRFQAEDGFTRGLNLRLNAPLRHLAPVAVDARQILGREAVHITWERRVSPYETLSSYTLLRNGEKLATLAGDATEYIDETVLNNNTYCYSLVSNYTDGISSSESYSDCVTCVLNSHLPVESLRGRAVGLNSLMVSWQTPVNSIPRLQYFDETAESYAFGVAGFDSEWGIRIPVADLQPFYGDSIRTFQFLPTGRQKGYEIRFYTGSTEGGYDTTPVYTQVIDPEMLQYNAVNTILLTTPMAVPEGKDLYIALYVHSAGNYDVLGIQYDGFRRGYTDLCRVIGVHDQFISIADESSETTEIVLPLGIGICSLEQLQVGQVHHYLVSEDGEEPISTPDLRYLAENILDGEHTYSVSAVYSDGIASPERTLDWTMVENEQAYLPVEQVTATVNEDFSASLTWPMPLDEDRVSLHYGDTTPTPGLPMQEQLLYYAAASVYPATLTRDYNNDYEIYGLYFCPTAPADFVLSLDNSNSEEGEILYTGVPTDIKLNQINYVRLSEPIRVDASIAYRFIVTVYGCEPNTSPLAFDSTNHCEDGFSNIFIFDYGETTLTQILQIDEHPNWLMGMLIRRVESPELPVEGFRVILDNELLTETYQLEATTTPLSIGTHTVQVDTRYSETRMVEGTPCRFEVSEDTALENYHLTSNDTTYDILGRIVRIPLRGGVYIQSGQKILLP